MKKYIIALFLSVASISFTFALTNNAQCISHTIPTTMYAGDTKTVTVTLKNTGTKIWTNNEGGATGNYDATLWPWPQASGNTVTPSTLLTLPGGPNVNILPGDSVTYTFDITAPLVNGIYPIQYRMLEQNVEWFGDSCGQIALSVVTPPKNYSRCISNTLPVTMYTGETKTVSVTYKNTGLASWTNNEGGATGNYDATLWPWPQASGNTFTPSMLTSIPNAPVISGDLMTYTFNLTAPTTTGLYPVSYRMLEQNVEWFGDSCGKDTVAVVDLPLLKNNAQCISSTIPSTMQAGESRLVSLTFKNTGSATWTNNEGGATGNYDAAMVNPMSSQIFTPSTLVSLPISQVITGNQVTYNFVLTATTAPGVYSSAYKMVEQNVEMFGESCGPNSITVTHPAQVAPISSISNVNGGTVVTWQGNGAPAWEPYTLQSDVKITSISASMTDMIKGSFFDFCVNVWRDGSPAKYPAYTGGYSEPICWSGLYRETNGNFSTTTDLSQSPVYLPAGTQITCEGHTNGSSAERSAAKRSCSLTFEPYHSGDIRYRVLRIPYLDEFVTPTTPFAGGQYKTIDANHPLHIKGSFYYIAFDEATSTNIIPCIQEKNAKGSILRKKCLSAQNTQSNTNFVSPGYVPIDWVVNSPNTIDASCTSSGKKSDCAFFLLTEIPQDTAVDGPENSFTDYGNISRPFLDLWCSRNPYITYDSFGKISSMLPDKAKCLSLFPQASCITSNTCWKKPLVNQLKGNIFNKIVNNSVVNFVNERGGSILGAITGASTVSAETISCVDITKNLHRGHETISVSKLQDFLFKKGLLSVSPTGFFGDKTVEAVKEYQNSKGIQGTGMVYDLTRQAIRSDSCSD